MTITERPVLDQVAVYIDRPADGMIVLGRSTLGAAMITYAWTGTAFASTSTATSGGRVVRTNELTDPACRNADAWVGFDPADYIEWDGSGITFSAGADRARGGALLRTINLPGEPGQVKSARAIAQGISDTGTLYALRINAYNAAGALLSSSPTGPTVTLPYGVSGMLTVSGWTLPTNTTSYAVVLVTMSDLFPAGELAQFQQMIAETADTAGAYFDGSSPATPDDTANDVLGSAITRVNVLPDAVQTITTNRGISSDDIASRKVQTGTLTLTTIDALDPEDDAYWWVRKGRPIQVVTAAGRSVFTGTIDSVRAESQWIDGRERTFVTLACSDAVSPLANITRYGAASGTGWETFAARAARLLASSGYTPTITATSKTDVPAMDTTATLFAVGSPAGGNLPEANYWKTTAPASVTGSANTAGRVSFVGGGTDAGDNTFTRTLTGLQPGKAYELAISLVWTIGGGTITLPATINDEPFAVSATSAATTTRVQFVATATTAVLTVTFAPAVQTLELSGLTLSSWSTDPYAIASVVYEGPIASHLDMLTASVPDAMWWVDADGVVQVTDTTAGEIAAALTDTTAGQLHYVALSRALDTTAIVNDLTVNNHGRRRAAADAGTSWEDYTPAYGYQDRTSSASWGAAAASIDTSLASVGAIERLAAATFQTAADPMSRVTAVTVNAQEDPETAATALDVAARIVVAYRGSSSPYRVLSVQHTITPTRWLVTATLGA